MTSPTDRPPEPEDTDADTLLNGQRLIDWLSDFELQARYDRTRCPCCGETLSPNASPYGHHPACLLHGWITVIRTPEGTPNVIDELGKQV